MSTPKYEIIKAPLALFKALDRMPFNKYVKGVLYGVVELTFNSDDLITIERLADHLGKGTSITNRFLGDLLAHRCVFRIQYKGQRYYYFLNEDYETWSDEWQPFR